MLFFSLYCKKKRGKGSRKKSKKGGRRKKSKSYRPKKRSSRYGSKHKRRFSRRRYGSKHKRRFSRRRYGSRRRFGKGGQFPGLNRIMGNYRPPAKMNTFQELHSMGDYQRDTHFAKVPKSLRNNFYANV